MEVEERITRSGLISQEKKISLPSSQSHSPRFLELVGKGLGQDRSPLIRATTIVCFIISSSHKAYLDCHRAHCVSFLVLRIHFFKILARITL